MRKTEGNIRQSYKTYKNSSDNAVDVKIYIIIAQKYLRFIMLKVLDGFEVVLPNKMGTLSIRGKKRVVRFNEDGTPILPVDYAKTKQLWKDCKECEEKKQILYHTNPHTDGVTYSYFWSKKNIFVDNKEFYSLRMTRDNKRMVSKLVNQGKTYLIKI